MSALYVNCPQCGPLMTFIPQGGQFEIDVKCLCGVKIAHKENGFNYETRRIIQAKFNSQKGKRTVQTNDAFIKNEQEGIVNDQCKLPGG